MFCSVFHFLKQDYDLLRWYLAEYAETIGEHHIEHFIELLNSRILVQGKSTYMLFAYDFSLYQERLKRAVIVFSRAIQKSYSVKLLIPEAYK